jgi:hypothetical protein
VPMREEARWYIPCIVMPDFRIISKCGYITWESSSDDYVQ